MKEKKFFRTCPKCSKTVGHTTVYARDKCEGRLCRSCSNRAQATGKTTSAETKAKLSAASKGRTASAETKAKLSASRKIITDACTEMYGEKHKHNINNLRQWGKKIQERDDYQCQCCGKEKTTPFSMHAHHITPCGYFPEMAFDILNGITLCSSCHRSLHMDLDRVTLAGIKLDAEGFREHYNIYMSNHSFLRPFIPSSVLDIELRSVSYLMQQLP